MPLLLSPFGYQTYRARRTDRRSRSEARSGARVLHGRTPCHRASVMEADRCCPDLEPLRQVAHPPGEGAPRRAAPHEIVDLTLDIQLEGAFEAVYVDGDNAAASPTDTMKNTVYALARQRSDRSRRGVRAASGGTFRRQAGGRRASASRPSNIAGSGCRSRGRPASARVRAAGRRAVDGGDHARRGRRADRDSGLTNLVVLKTADSAFAGFPRDELTTLPETDDRLLATSITASLDDTVPGCRTSRCATRSARRWSRRSPVTRADRCSTRCTRWARRRWRPAPTIDRDHADAAEPSSSARRS